MFKFRFILMLAFLFLLAACAPSDPAVDSVTVETTRATAVLAEPTLPTEALATEFIPTADPTPTEPLVDVDDLIVFIGELKTAVINQNYAAMQTSMGDTIAVGAWRSEWRVYSPEQIVAEFQAAALPAPLAVTFTGLDMDGVAALLDGQPPATMFGPDVNVVAALHSTGWGQSTSDEAILLVTQQDGRYTWSGFLYTNGRFADANLGTAAAPAGLIYIVWGNGVYQIQPDGQHRQLLDAQEANIPNIHIAPDGRHAAYTNEQQQLWLLDTATGEQQQFAADYTPSGYLQWGDKNTLFVGIWLDPNEADGPNNGHIATLDINSGDLQILDETRLSGGRPALLSDYNWVSFDVYGNSQDDILTGRTYHPDSGLQTFDQTAFSGNSGYGIYNSAWSPAPNKIAWLTGDGERRMVQLFDIEAKTAVTLFDWDPARFGGLIPSPVWSPDGQWLALEVVANGPEGSGIWLIAADGSSQTLVDAAGHEPYWVNDFQLIYGVNNGPRLYDIHSGESFIMGDLPQGSWVLGITSEADLTAQPEVVPTEDNTDTSSTLPDPADLVMTVEQLASADGRWQATINQSEPIATDNGDKFYTSLTVEDGTTSWQPLAEWRAYGLGYAFPAIYRWSADGRYLYYNNALSSDGCTLFQNAIDLYRLDVTDGTTTTVLDTGLTTNLALSPDETTVAYTQFNGQTTVVFLHDVAGGNDQSVVVAVSTDAQAGNILWSPDGTQLLLTVAHEPCSGNWTHSIIRVHVDSLTAVPLITQDDRQFTIVDWSNPEQAIMRLMDKDSHTWLLDVDSGNLIAE